MEKSIKNEIAVYVLNDKKQILLQKRSANKKHFPNMWNILTGHVEKNESIIDAAIREIQEEIGLTIDINDIHPLNNHQFTLRTDNGNTFYFIIRCNLKEEDFIIQEEELSEVKWVNIREIMNMIKMKDSTITLGENKLIALEYLSLL